MLKIRKKYFLAAVSVAFMWFIISSNSFDAHAAAFSIEQGTENNIKYITGGVGMDERTAMEGMSDHYNLKLIFASNKGAFLSNVKVMIQDANHRRIIDKESNGPWFFVDLPKGQYHVTVSHDGKKETQKLALEKASDTVVFNWKINGSRSM